nr:LacI family DNA-binding transcriptional regulator [uncultured Pseudomonas sp.]
MSDGLSKKNLDDVAKRAGVSLSTVGRVLNERGSVSDAKRRAVISAAKELGLRRLLPSAVHGLLRIDLLMVRSDTDHYRRLTEAFTRLADLHRSRLIIQRMLWSDTHPAELLNLIKHPKTPRQALIVVAHDTPLIRLALQEQIAKGVSVILLTSGLTELSGATFVGIDNFQAGQCAGRLLRTWIGEKTGNILLATNSMLFHAHQERIRGFLSIFKEIPSLAVTRPAECFDLDTHTLKAVIDTHMSGPALVGIYNTGSGSKGIRRALLDLNIRPIWVAHEDTDEHVTMLREDILSVVIDQDPAGQAEAAIEHILSVAGDIEVVVHTTRQLRIVIFEMLPSR